MFGGQQKDRLLQATLDWHLAQPPSFWQGAYLTPKGIPEFSDGESFAKYYSEEVRAVSMRWTRRMHVYTHARLASLASLLLCTLTRRSPRSGIARRTL